MCSNITDILHYTFVKNYLVDEINYRFFQIQFINHEYPIRGAMNTHGIGQILILLEYLKRSNDCY